MQQGWRKPATISTLLTSSNQHSILTKPFGRVSFLGTPRPILTITDPKLCVGPPQNSSGISTSTAPAPPCYCHALEQHKQTAAWKEPRTWYSRGMCSHQADVGPTGFLEAAESRDLPKPSRGVWVYFWRCLRWWLQKLLEMTLSRRIGTPVFCIKTRSVHPGALRLQPRECRDKAAFRNARWSSLLVDTRSCHLPRCGFLHTLLACFGLTMSVQFFRVKIPIQLSAFSDFLVLRRSNMPRRRSWAFHRFLVLHCLWAATPCCWVLCAEVRSHGHPAAWAESVLLPGFCGKGSPSSDGCFPLGCLPQLRTGCGPIASEQLRPPVCLLSPTAWIKAIKLSDLSFQNHLGCRKESRHDVYVLFI